jgi:hypothetical protein
MAFCEAVKASEFVHSQNAWLTGRFNKINTVKMFANVAKKPGRSSLICRQIVVFHPAEHHPGLSLF